MGVRQMRSQPPTPARNWKPCCVEGSYFVPTVWGAETELGTFDTTGLLYLGREDEEV